MTDMAVYTTGPDTTRNTNFGGGSTTFRDKARIYDGVIHSVKLLNKQLVFVEGQNEGQNE